MLNVAINGLGRIGRATLKILKDHAILNVVAVNDLIPADREILGPDRRASAFSHETCAHADPLPALFGSHLP